MHRQSDFSCEFKFTTLVPLCTSLFPYTTLFRSRGGELVLQFLGERGGASQQVRLRGAEALQLLARALVQPLAAGQQDRKSTRLNSSHLVISYAVFCLKKKTQPRIQ